uniref:Putative conserved secreted protein n=1 Tax=Aedes albopictus TaxID=7160 RepID=A0A1W7R791_AEDAL
MFSWRTISVAFVVTTVLGSQLAWTRAESDAEKYCKYLDCQGGKIKQGESFAATNFAFGYCTCGNEDGKKYTRYIPCNFGQTYSLEKQTCMQGVAKA